MKAFTTETIEDVAIGSAILGAGGGGDPYIGRLLALQSVNRFGPVPVVDIRELPDDARVAMVAGIGAPGVLIEKLPRVDEAVRAVELLEAHLGERFTHLCPARPEGSTRSHRSDQRLPWVSPFSTRTAWVEHSHR